MGGRVVIHDHFTPIFALKDVSISFSSSLYDISCFVDPTFHFSLAKPTFAYSWLEPPTIVPE